MIGRTLSHYKILSEISRGGMGIVYRALDVNLDREVALKVLPPELVAGSERKRRFVQEAKSIPVFRDSWEKKADRRRYRP
jgi:serine/threonine protein kinase